MEKVTIYLNHSLNHYPEILSELNKIGVADIKLFSRRYDASSDAPSDSNQPPAQFLLSVVNVIDRYGCGDYVPIREMQLILSTLLNFGLDSINYECTSYLPDENLTEEEEDQVLDYLADNYPDVDRDPALYIGSYSYESQPFTPITSELAAFLLKQDLSAAEFFSAVASTLVKGYTYPPTA